MSVEEILFEAEETMEKSVDYMIHEFSAVRTGQSFAGARRERGRRSLRLVDEAEAARAHHHARAASPRGAALRCFHRQETSRKR